MAAVDLVTLAEFTRYLRQQGANVDAAEEARASITDASRRIEGVCGRRLVFRAPVAAGETLLANSQTWATGAIAIAAQPSADGRTLKVEWSVATAGTLSITGIVAGASKTVVLNVLDGLVQHVPDFFTGTVSATAAGTAGGGTLTISPSLGYVEHHTFSSDTCRAHELVAMERPIIQVNEANEDYTREFGSSTRLVATTDYEVSAASGKVLRVSSKMAYSWATGWRAVRLTYSAGYRGPAGVPMDLKREALRVAALLYEEAIKHRVGVSSVTDATGNFTRFGPAGVPRETERALWAGGHVCMLVNGGTGARDFDEEAA